MSDSARIEELRRRIDADPASIAFAALADEYRLAGRFVEAVNTCRTGLARHPGYLSARVTLGRCLVELNDLTSARAELEQVVRVAPDNRTAWQALEEIARREAAAGPSLSPADVASPDPDSARVVLGFFDTHDSGHGPVGSRPVVPTERGDRPRPAGMDALERWQAAIARRQERRASEKSQVGSR